MAAATAAAPFDRGAHKKKSEEDEGIVAQWSLSTTFESLDDKPTELSPIAITMHYILGHHDSRILWQVS